MQKTPWLPHLNEIAFLLSGWKIIQNKPDRIKVKNLLSKICPGSSNSLSQYLSIYLLWCLFQFLNTLHTYTVFLNVFCYIKISVCRSHSFLNLEGFVNFIFPTGTIIFSCILVNYQQSLFVQLRGG